MQTRFYIRKSIAVGQKTAKTPSAYGQGFNYQVEVGFALDSTFCDTNTRLVADVLAAIDHKALGLDVALGFEPTSGRLCYWLASEIQKRTQCAEIQVRLVRGDGLTVTSVARAGILRGHSV
jgi:hypothetical protein